MNAPQTSTRSGIVGFDIFDINSPFPKPKGQRGGYRRGAGRPKGAKNKNTIDTEQRRASLQSMILGHVLHKERVPYFDKHGNIKVKLRTRLQAVLDQLFQLGMKGSISAICTYLDYTIGKPGYMPRHYASQRVANKAVQNQTEKNNVHKEQPKALLAAKRAYEKAMANEGTVG